MSALGEERTLPAQGTDANVLTDIEHEIELASETVADITPLPHQQFGLKQAITQVRWLVGEIELGGEQAAARRLHLHVIVPCAAANELWHDGAKAKSAVEPGGDMAHDRKPILSYSPLSSASSPFCTVQLEYL